MKNSKDKIIRTTCGLCQIGCGVLAHVRGTEVVKIVGDPDNPLNKGVICPKGAASLEYLYHPDRLRSPLKRAGERGEGKWTPISWEEALHTVAKNLSASKDRYGAASVAFMRGAAKGVQDEYLTRFANIFGSPNFLSMGYVCFVPRRNASVATYGYYAIPDVEFPSKTIIVWGINASETLHHVYLRIKKALKKGARLIVIDPVKNRIAQDADLWIRLKPGSDLALALGILHVIVNESLYDSEFVKNHTIGFEQLRDHLEGYAPERVSDITWVPPEVIRGAARLYATGRPASIQWGNGIDHTPDNFQTARLICIMRAITGNLEAPGGDLRWIEPPILPRASKQFSLHDMIPPDVRKMRLTGGETLLPNAFYALQQSVTDAIITEKPYPVKAAYIQGGNPLLSYPNARKVCDALQKLDFVAVSDIFMTPTVALADIVLPSVTYLEFDSIVAPTYSLAVATVQQKVARIAGCRPDYDALRDLARHMGMGEYFWDTEEESLDCLLKPAGITFSEFRSIAVLNGTFQYRSYIDKGFPTASGKVEIYAGQLEKRGFDPLPVYRPANGTGDNMKERYPLLLTSWKRAPYRHSGGRQIHSLRGMHPEPVVLIHPDTAKRFSIENSDLVCIETERGTITQRAQLDKHIDLRVIGVDYGWWFPEDRESPMFGWDRANVNVIIDDKPPYGREMGTPRLRGIPCRIYKRSI